MPVLKDSGDGPGSVPLRSQLPIPPSSVRETHSVRATTITSRNPAPLHLCSAPFVIARRQNVSTSWVTTGDEVWLPP